MNQHTNRLIHLKCSCLGAKTDGPMWNENHTIQGANKSVNYLA